MELKPKILTHPNIPKPLHGVAPREIMGKDWWDETRQKVYASTDYHCVACGVAKKDAKKFQWLEAHEFYDIDYMKGVSKILSIEPLCHYCHNFIHSGRLRMIMGRDKSEQEVREILEHGLKVLAENKLKCFPSTLEFAEDLGCDTFKVKAYKIKANPKVEWSDWKLIWEGKEYKSKFANFEEWQNHYQK
jgi:predicted HNH restriction endonuclease